MTISLNNIQTATSTSSATLNLNDYVVSAAIPNRILIIMVSGESDTSVIGSAVVSSMTVTFGGNAMTAGSSFAVINNGAGNTINAWAQIWYMLNPPSGTTDDFVVTLNQTTTEFASYAVLLGSALQQAPTDSNTFTGTSSPINSALTVTPSAGIVLETIRCGNTSNFTITGTGHVQIGSEIDQSSSTCAAGYNLFTSSGSKSISWTNSSVNRYAQAAAAFQEAPPLSISNVTSISGTTTMGF